MTFIIIVDNKRMYFAKNAVCLVINSAPKTRFSPLTNFGGCMNLEIWTHVLTFVAGLSFSLFGMQLMSGGLEQLSGGMLERTLERATSNRFAAIALGAGVTAVVQSSSATTVMVVGFVNSGIMRLEQVVGIIMGANIGTTITSWLLSLTGLSGDSFILWLLNPSTFSPILALVGIVLMLFSQKERRQITGRVLLSFALLMFGMSVMGDSVKPLADSPTFANLLVMFRNPILGVLVGAVFTGIIQSSAATVGVLIALAAALSGSDSPITYGVALPIVLGSNIGTCVTALISCIGAGKNARRSAMVHLYFNTIGTILFLVVFYALNAIFRFEFINYGVSEFGIALIHTVFNVLATIVFLPMPNLLCRLAEITIPDKSKNREKAAIRPIDERLLATPSVAVEVCARSVAEMMETAKQTALNAIALTKNYTSKLCDSVSEGEKLLDKYEDMLATYMVKLSAKQLPESDAEEINHMLHVIGDCERIGDHSLNMLESANEMHKNGLRFSDAANTELDVIRNALSDIITLSFTSYAERDLQGAKRVEPLEDVIDALQESIRDRHISRLQEGKCTIRLGFVLNDMLTNMERISDHCSNIAVCLLQKHDSYSTHSFMENVKHGDSDEFDKAFVEYKAEYSLPSEK